MHKQTKSENIFALIRVIFDFETQTDQKNKRTEKTAAISKEKDIVIMAIQSPKKGLTCGKCFVLPMMNSKLKQVFGVFDAFEWRLGL